MKMYSIGIQVAAVPQVFSFHENHDRTHRIWSDLLYQVYVDVCVWPKLVDAAKHGRKYRILLGHKYVSAYEFSARAYFYTWKMKSVI